MNTLREYVGTLHCHLSGMTLQTPIQAWGSYVKGAYEDTHREGESGIFRKFETLRSLAEVSQWSTGRVDPVIRNSEPLVPVYRTRSNRLSFVLGYLSLRPPPQ